MFDNSGSMNQEIQTALYDPTISYPIHRDIDPGAVFYLTRSRRWQIFKGSTADISCESARVALETSGFYNGRIRWNGSCGGRVTRYLRTGNYRNYLLEVGGEGPRPKLEIAKEITKDFVMTTHGVRLGVMVFNHDEGGRIQHPVQEMSETSRRALCDSIDAIEADTWTPLAESLYEAGLYFKGEPSYFNGKGSHTSPIQHWCQNNYVIIVTDGEPTKDRNPILQTIGSSGDTDGDGHEPGGADEIKYDSEGSDYLDDVCEYLYDTDLRADLSEKQNIITYTIGFSISTQLLEDAAENGGGRYYDCYNARELSEVFQEIFQRILEDSSSYTAPVVPISQMQKTTSDSKIYLALFEPSENAFWAGNIKKFGLVMEDQLALDLQVGDVVDVNGNAATDATGYILDTAVSRWGAGEPDGGYVQAGGVGQVLLTRTTPRSLHTYLGHTTVLADPSNAFVLDNSSITPERLGFDEGETSARDRLIRFIHGHDAYDEDGDSDTDEKRRWILGAFLHSRPEIVHYDDATTVIFAGANDGMLHAFDDATGEELWAFIPPDLLGKLKSLRGTTLEYYVDGSPRAVVMDLDLDGSIEPEEGDQVILVFGERRGGNHYYALDVSDPTSPLLLWDISPAAHHDDDDDDDDGMGSEFAEMGQSWCTPVFGRIAYGNRLVAFLSGGYDTNQDDDPVLVNDTMGRGLYIVELATGDLLWKYTYHEDPDMLWSIPSDVAALDTTDNGFIDRLYVGDTGGRLWRYDIGARNPEQWTARLLFDANLQDDGRQKIFYPPDVTLEENYAFLFFGTGDRAHPKNETVLNRVYAIKDLDSGAVISEDSLVDVTNDLLQDPDTDDDVKALIREDLNSGNGWFIRLEERVGEKVLAPPMVFFGVAYFTTFSPTQGSADDPCYVGEGHGQLYALDYKTGEAVINLDTENDPVGGITLGRSDRSLDIGSGIPSRLVVAILGGRVSAYVGIGGGILHPHIEPGIAFVSLYWREMP
jgi:type IV pilus assembly protein PilY1